MRKKHFLIQTINGLMPFDFQWELFSQLQRQEVKADFTYSLYEWSGDTGNIPTNAGTIPVGSVEFVLEYLRMAYFIYHKPVNIPEELQKQIYLQRDYRVHVRYGDIPFERCFVKERKHKGFADVVDSMTSQYLNAKSYYNVSELIDIESEWRCFVHRGNILDIRCYSGDPWQLPDKDMVESMVKDYESAPIAYTLDVAVCERGTVIIECHDFFSCGLYGFNSPKLPYMLSQAFFEIVKNK